MENNLLYKDYSIFTKTPQIYLNLNTTITKNLNVENTTNLNTLNVQNYSNLNGQLNTDNIYTNKDLIVNGKTTLNNRTNLNSNLYLNHSENSSNITSGTLIVSGGVGISKNVFIGGNTTVENNLNVLKVTNINENLNVLNTTTLNKVNILNDINISKNLNVKEFTTIYKNLNIQSNIITQHSNIVYKDIIGHNSLTIEKDSQFKSNLTVYGNFAVLGERFNIVSEQTLVADPLVVFGINQSQTFDNSYGGFVVNHNDKYSGLVRQPASDGNFYLYKNIDQKEDEFVSNKFNPDLDSLSTHDQYGNLFLNNINTNKITSNIIHNTGIGSFGYITSGIGTFSGTITAQNGIIGDLNGNATTSTTASNVLNIKNDTDNSQNFITFLNDGTSNTSGIGQQIRTHNDLSFYPNICELYVGTPGGKEGCVRAKELRGDLIGSVITSSQTNINELGTLTYLNVGEVSNNETGKITAKDLVITNNIAVSNDVRISGNLVVSGNSVIVITNHFDINDPIFTISNNSPHYDRGMLVNNGKLNVDDPEFYSGLIRKDDDSNFYLLDKIQDSLAQTVPTVNKATLVVKNLNTTQTSHINGLKFIENNDFTNTNNTIATFPNNSSSEHIVFHKKTKFEENLLVNSNLNLNGNLSVSEQLTLLNTHSLISHGTTELLGNTTISGKLDITKSVIECDHVNIRSFFNNLGYTRTKDMDADNIVVVDKLRFPIRETIISTNDSDFPANKTGYVIFNKDKELFEGFNGRTWIPLGIDPDSTTGTLINSTLTVSKNINAGSSIIIDNNLEVKQNTLIKGELQVNDNLIIPSLDGSEPELTHVRGTIFFNSSNNSYEGYHGGVDKWRPLGGIDAKKDTFIKKDLYVEQNVNVTQNININDSLNVSYNITSNNNTTLHNLIVPTHDEISNTLDSNTGSIYFNKSSNLFYGHNNDTWLPLGGINPYTDTTIDHNLFVKKNINIDGNVNIKKNLNINSNVNIDDNINIKKNINVDDNVNVKKNINVDDNVNIKKNINVDGNLNVENNINVISSVNSSLNSNNSVVYNNLIVPNHDNTSNLLNSTSGSIYFNNSTNLFYGHNNDSWLPLGGINPYTDTTIDHNLNIIKKTVTNSLLVNGMSQFNGLVYVDNKLTSKELIIPSGSNTTSNSINSNGTLYINYNGSHSQLKLRLNDHDNVIPFNNNPIVQLTSSTDLFQFYNVQMNQPIFGNRITGLNDPAFNSFTKFYTLKEFTFFQETILTDIEFYVSHSINNTIPTTNLNIQLEIFKNSDQTAVLTQSFTSVPVATVSFSSLTGFTNDLFIKNDKIKVRLTLNNNYNGHEIFVRLHGTSKIHPRVDKLHILDTTNPIGNTNTPALLVNGGARFDGSIIASNISAFTGCHISKLITAVNYDSNYTYYENSMYIYKPGLIVSVDNSTLIHIDKSEFNIKISNTIGDKTVFGVINSYIGDNKYYINSLGEGALWVSNINGDINNGDYIMSSNILGYGCKQNDDILHSYTVAKCCSVINWNSINSYINHYNNTYKIAFIACTYHCG